MASVIRKPFSQSEIVKEFDNVKINIVNLNGATFTRATCQPGWKWSTDVKQHAKTLLCTVHHLSTVVSGKMVVHMVNGEETTIEAGDVVLIPANHDAWVPKDAKEPCVLLDFNAGGSAPAQQQQQHNHHHHEHAPQIDAHPNAEAVKQFVTSYWTGNPVNLKEYQKMIQEDIVVESHKLVSIDLISIVSHDTAIVHATHEERFSYKGTKNADIAKYSMTLVRTNHGWRVCHLHRCGGKSIN